MNPIVLASELAEVPDEPTFSVVTGELVNHPVEVPKEVVIDYSNVTLYQVCSCESGNGKHGTPQQFEKDGVTPLVGKLTPPHLGQDIGMCQINTLYHLESSINLGYDIDTAEGNWGYATHLFETQGLQPWSASKPCWK